MLEKRIESYYKELQEKVYFENFSKKVNRLKILFLEKKLIIKVKNRQMSYFP